MKEPLLLSPFEIRGVRLKNRVVLSPMLTYSSVAGHVGDALMVHLGKMAAGGAGLVFMEATKVDPRGCSTIRDAGIWKDEFVPALRRVTTVVREFGGISGVQLSHSGRKARCSLPWEGRKPLMQELTVDGDRAWELLAPSAVAHGPNYAVPREMTAHDIHEALDAWALAAKRADEAGFDVVEIHAAHGYLLHQFLSPGANLRTDGYGGSFENRVRFPLEVVRAVRTAWPERKPLFVRISCTDTLGWQLEHSVRFAGLLAREGVDIVDCSDGGFEQGAITKRAHALDYGYQVDLAGEVRRTSGAATMAVGLIVHPFQAERILQDGKADLVALGRELLHNPNWPVDAAQKFGLMPSHPGIPEQYGYWLDKRVDDAHIVPSTWFPGEDPRLAG